MLIGFANVRTTTRDMLYFISSNLFVMKNKRRINLLYVVSLTKLDLVIRTVVMNIYIFLCLIFRISLRFSQANITSFLEE